MSDDIEMVYFEGAGNAPCYLESLVRSLKMLEHPELTAKLITVIDAELDLALLGAEKAKSEILKADKDNTVRPIK